MHQAFALLSQFRYDPLDRLHLAIHAEQPPRLLFYRLNRQTSEVQESASCSLLQFQDRPLALHEKTANRTAQVDLLATDSQLSVLHKLGSSCARTYRYLPYGYCPPEAAALNTPGFNGEFPATSTGHYLLGSYRAFIPALGRFNKPDNLSPFGDGGLNPYAYCAGDPLNSKDPDGHTPLSGLLKVLGKSRRAPGAPGFSLKPIQVIEGPNIHSALFIDSYKGKLRLNISGHSTLAKDQPMRLHRDAMDITAEQLAPGLEQLFDLNQFGSIRTLACHSANPWGGFEGLASYGERLAELTGLPVKAYLGKVTSRAPEVLEADTLSSLGLAKSVPGKNYMPMLFYPQQPRLSAIRRTV